MSDHALLFQAIDADHNGQLSFGEFSAFCEALPNAPAASVVQRLFSQADVDNSGFIDPTEFAALCEGVKLLTKLSDSELAESYSISELKRLFKYSAANGEFLRKDEIRKAADVVNEGLDLRLSNDSLAQAIRDCGGDSIDFLSFRQLIHRLAPGISLTAVVSAFKVEESRRKDRLEKVKSMFELRKQAPVVPNSRGTRTDQPRSGKCSDCELLELEVDEKNMMLQRQAETIEDLKHQLVKKEEDLAVGQVESQRAIRKLESELVESSSRQCHLEDKIGQLTRLNAEAVVCMEKLEKQADASEKAEQREHSLMETIENLKSELEQMSTELRQANGRIGRLSQDSADLGHEVDHWKRRCQQCEGEIDNLKALMEDLSRSKVSDSEHSDRLIGEYKRRCDEAEQRTQEAVAHAAAMKEHIASREREMTVREDAVTIRERKVAQFEGRQKLRWEEKFVKAQAEIDRRELALRDAEGETATKTAELQIREQLLEQNIRRAESISLPERERRLRILQGIEQELCDRERRLRQAESDYVSKLLHPEIERLKDENRKLYGRMEELTADRDASMVFPTRGRGKPLEKGIMSPSFKLL